MATDDDSILSVTGTAHLGDTDVSTDSTRLGHAALGLVAGVLVVVTTLTAVRTGNANVGIGLVGAAVLTVGTAAVLELAN